MKRYVVVILLGIIVGSMFFGSNNASGQDYKEKLIRFHVIANSDSKEDQNVKLKVRDAVLKEIGPKLQKAKSKEEAIEIINRNIDKIVDISNKTLNKNGFKYTSKATIGTYKFPIKNYGDITLQEGEYTALRIVLGEGGGKNWWCVMFPPLCFIDITKGLTTENTQKELKRVLNDDEVKEVVNLNDEQKLQKEVIENQSQQQVVFKFKIVEVIENLLNK
ncbi:MAG: stage II sporulation protein R [Clostridiales bacterium]|nr:stage II sporulation protein R [Clostridiales bacterium]